MTSSTFSRGRSGRLAAITSVLTAIVVAAAVLVLALAASLPEAWWPHTGQAFAADNRPTNQDPCALIVGPAKEYCERGTTPIGSTSERPDGSGAAWALVPAGAGLAALVVWRWRSSAGRRRR